MFLDVQARVVRLLHGLAARHGESTLVLVTHADIIRSILAAAGGVAPELSLRFHIAPASITTVHMCGSLPEIVAVNDTAHLEG
jgi:broad specificity phosphatase PhoE